jgi:hypothetical protein
MFKIGDIWSSIEDSDMFVITTNSYLKKNGDLVMGAGIAKEAAERYSLLPGIFGSDIARSCGHLGEYYILYWKKIIALQTKRHFKDKSDLKLIHKSLQTLIKYVRPYHKVDMVFPGIGYGQLEPKEVLENIILKDMIKSKNITIWSNKEIEF